MPPLKVEVKAYLGIETGAECADGETRWSDESVEATLTASGLGAKHSQGHGVSAEAVG